MDLILCHTTADFDALAAAVGLTCLQPGARVVLTGGTHPTVRDFLALHRDEYALIERRSVNPEQIRSITVVDTQKRERLGKAAEWLDLPQLEFVAVYDHHPDTQLDIPATRTQIESVGATTTLVVEQLQQAQTQLTSAEATLMALGIHVDTGSLTFEQATPRDALALAWLMTQGVSLRVVAEYADPSLSPQLQALLTEALNHVQKSTQLSYTVSWVILKTAEYVPGLSSLTTRLIELTESDALLLASVHPNHPKSAERLTVIGRSHIPGIDLNELFKPLGGGGHAQAASLTLRGVDAQATLDELVNQLRAQIPQPPTARELMSSPVRTILPETTIEQARSILLRYGHSGLCVVEAPPADQTGAFETREGNSSKSKSPLVGIISVRDIDLALHHGFGHAPVKGYMKKNLKTITPDTQLSEIESLMVTYDIGRLPVLAEDQLMGIVTRTDVLRQLHQERGESNTKEGSDRERINHVWNKGRFKIQNLKSKIQNSLVPQLREVLTQAAEQAQQRGWQLYLVGGAVRDLLLADSAEGRETQPLLLQDIDLVVDGFHRSAAGSGAGVELARALQKIYPDVRLEVHGSFQTAALLWHKDPMLGSLWVDIATARTEFYPYPAANPEVEASSIRQDLYRRDFTINALALRLTSGRPQELPLLDFFGGLLDLQSRQIRVLHANSFIEDPTRIYRAVRFAVRLGFEIEPQTEAYIRYALESGVYQRSLAENNKAPALQTRLKGELKYILQAPFWKPALRRLADLEALRCIHPTLELNARLWWQVRLASRWLRQFDPHKSLDHWQIRLEVLIAHLAPEYRGKVAANLQLPEESIDRVQQLSQAEVDLSQGLAVCQRPSQVVQLLQPYKLLNLVLIAVQSSQAVRKQIWQYLAIGVKVEPPLNGNDLKALGYKPGRQFKQILDELLTATLDGEIRDRSSAEAFLAKHYPQ